MAVSTYGYMRRLALAAVAATALMGPANAASIGTEPLGGVNDVINPGGNVAGFFGANLFALGSFQIEWTYLGHEASFTNTFTAPGGPGGSFTTPGTIGSTFIQTVGPGLITFDFSTTGGGGTVNNGSNPDGKTAPSTAPNFFISFYEPDGSLCTNLSCVLGGGSGGILAFDDGGGGSPQDGDYDDLVVQFMVVGGPTTGTFSSGVPEVSTWAMMLIGFAGLGFFAYRRKSNITFRLA